LLVRYATTNAAARLAPAGSAGRAEALDNAARLQGGASPSPASGRQADQLAACIKGDGPASIAACTAVIDSNAYGGEPLAQLYYLRGLARGFAAPFDLALGDLNRSIQLAPSHGETYFQRGTLYRVRGDLDLRSPISIRLSRSGRLRRRPCWARHGVFYPKGYDRAMADFNSGIAVSPGHAPSYYGRALVDKAGGDDDRALADLTASITSRSDFADSFALRGSFTKAKASTTSHWLDTTKAVALNPGASTSTALVARPTPRFCSTMPAVADYTKAIGLDPGNAAAYSALGSAHSAHTNTTRRRGLGGRFREA